MKQAIKKPILLASKPIRALTLSILLGASGLAGAQDFGWGPNTATGLAGGCPIESRNGNQLFVAGGFEGSLDIFYYERRGRSDSFGNLTKAANPFNRLQFLQPSSAGLVSIFLLALLSSIFDGSYSGHLACIQSGDRCV